MVFSILTFSCLFFLLSVTPLQSQISLHFPVVQEKETVPFFTQTDIENLKDSLPPLYIQFLDMEEYTRKGTLLKKGILFTYRNLHAKTVYLSGNFNNYTFIPMKRNPQGVFYWVQPAVKVDGEILKEYIYKFYVDGVWVTDPQNSGTVRIGNNMYSYLSIEPEEEITVTFSIKKTETDITGERIYLVEFRVHEDFFRKALRKSKGGIQSVYITGDFTYWNFTGEMKKDSKGFYTYTTWLKKGEYHYVYVVDGEWVLDPFHSRTRYHQTFRRIVNVISLP